MLFNKTYSALTASVLLLISICTADISNPHTKIELEEQPDINGLGFSPPDNQAKSESKNEINFSRSNDIAVELTERFNDVNTTTCHDSKNDPRPAYMCSGILIRGVGDLAKRNLTYAWSFKPLNRKKTSFSVVFLRKDAPVSHGPKYAYDSGYILYPHLHTPTGKNTYEVYCAFPVDGYTDGREKHHGCEQSPQSDDPENTSGRCFQQGITSFSEWKHHYDKIQKANGDFDRRQCSFNMQGPTAAADFSVLLKANSYLHSLQPGSLFRNNELLFRTWSEARETKPNVIPIQAFFYLLDFPEAYVKAKKYRDTYQDLTAEKLPVVGIHFPTPTNQNIFLVTAIET